MKLDAGPSSPLLSEQPQLPSSPPLLPDDVADHLPTLYSSQMSAEASFDSSFMADRTLFPRRSSMPQNSRVLELQSSSFGCDSSDPPLFSSEDHPNSVDVGNYSTPRNKRKRPGPWWETNLDAQPGDEEKKEGVKKTKFSRNMDSGIWMNSDDKSSDDTDDSWSTLDEEERLPVPPTKPVDPDCENTIPDIDRNTYAELAETLYFEDSLMENPWYRNTRVMRTMLRRFPEIVKQGVEENRTVYHLDDLAVSDQDIHCLSKLNQVIREPLDPGEETPGAEYYASFQPDLYVSLCNNFLRYLVPELFSVQNITHLVLRNNQIEELPQEICGLRNLETLDLSQNNIKWLPLEITSLLRDPSNPDHHGKLENLLLVGNPLIEAPFEEIERRLSLRSPDDWSNEMPPMEPHLLADWRLDWLRKLCYTRRLGLTFGLSNQTQQGPDAPLFKFVNFMPPTYYDECGKLLPGSSPPFNSNKDFLDWLYQIRGPSGPDLSLFVPLSNSRIRSLASVCLTTALDMASPAQIEELTGPDQPLSLQCGLRAARQNSKNGYDVVRFCHGCGKPYVLARVEALEFMCFQDWRHLPVKRILCSWGCVPEEYVSDPFDKPWPDSEEAEDFRKHFEDMGLEWD